MLTASSPYLALTRHFQDQLQQARHDQHPTNAILARYRHIIQLMYIGVVSYRAHVPPQLFQQWFLIDLQSLLQETRSLWYSFVIDYVKFQITLCIAN